MARVFISFDYEDIHSKKQLTTGKIKILELILLFLPGTGRVKAPGEKNM